MSEIPVKTGEMFISKIGKVRVDDVTTEKITYTIFPTERNHVGRRTIVDSVETFNRRFPDHKK